MKLTTLLLITGLLHVAAGTYPQQKKLNVVLNNATIEEVFSEIEKQSEFKFLYRNELIDIHKKVNIHLKGRMIQEILNELFKNERIDFQVLDDNLIVITPSSSSQKKFEVKGTVTNVSGDPLPGVNIVEKGTTSGTVTNIQGEFSFHVSDPSAKLLVSYIGYNTMEVAINNQHVFSIQMEENIKALDEVIVVGYGTQKKSDITGAITSIEAERVNQIPVLGIEQALQGQAPGVHITQNTGSPGSAVSVRIRGTGTVGSSAPLYVVDGLPFEANEISYLNPGDIESVQILKDASSTAIYGSRGANGIIMITTKKGTPGKKGKVNFEAYRGVQSVWRYMDLMNAREFIGTRNLIGGYPEEELPADSMSTDWQKEVFRDAPMSNYQLSFYGGGENSAYAISGNYFDQQGIVKSSGYKRLSFRVNSSTRINKYIDIGENMAFVNSKRDRIPEADEWTSVMITTITIDPATPVYSDETTWHPSIRNNINNPVGILERNNDSYKMNKLAGNFFIDIKPLKGFKIRSNMGVKMTYGDVYIYRPTFEMSPTEQRIESEVERENEKWQNWVWENIATYSNSFGKNTLTALFGVTAEETVYDNVFALAYDVPDDARLRYLDNADPANESRTISGEAWEHRLYSVLGRLEYAFDNKYLLNMSFRRDGSSVFGEENRYGFFPAFGMAWKISEENFTKNIPLLYNAKLRLGWGQIGNQNIGDSKYPFSALVNSGYNYILGVDQSLVSGGAPITSANSKLKWETTTSSNLGLDLGLFRNKLLITADYFIRNTSDMLVKVPIPGHTGIEEAPYDNAGEIQNKGLELSLTYRKLEGRLKYSLSANMSSVKNEVISLGKGGQDIYGASFRASNFASITRVGHPVASFYGYSTDGLFQTQDEIDRLNAIAQENGFRAFQDKRTAPGDIRFKDLNNDGTIDDDDRQIIGNPHPTMYYGMHFNIAWAGFDINVTGQGTFGNDLFNATIWYTESLGYWNMTRRVKDFWSPENTDTEIPRLDPNGNNENYRLSDRFVEDGSYLRIKNLQLGYTLPTNITSYIGVEKLRIYFGAQNLLTVTNYSGFDPEIGIGVDREGAKKQSGTLDIGVDRGTYPQARIFMGGINLTF